mgnify:CR=1 FL=1
MQYSCRGCRSTACAGRLPRFLSSPSDIFLRLHDDSEGTASFSESRLPAMHPLALSHPHRCIPMRGCLRCRPCHSSFSFGLEACKPAMDTSLSSSPAPGGLGFAGAPWTSAGLELLLWNTPGCTCKTHTPRLSSKCRAVLLCRLPACETASGHRVALSRFLCA